MRRKLLLIGLAVLSCGIGWSADLPLGATLVYSGAYDSTYYDCAYFRSASGEYWRWLLRKADGEVMTETRYGNLSTFRNALLTIDDQTGLMGSALWRVDSDGDGFSDMLEYLTNGDPWDANTVPTEPRILAFDDGQSYEVLLPTGDMADSGGRGESADAAALREVAKLLEDIKEVLRLLLVLVAFCAGLFLWRLAVLAFSRRNLV